MTLMKILHYWDGEQWIPLQPLGQIGRSGLADGSVTTSKLADDAVTAAKIAADAVGSSEIAANAVGASELADNAVDTGALAAGAVTEAKQTLADNTTNDVTSTKHGYAPKSLADATKFLNSAATPVYAQVKDSDLSTSDITTNDVTTSKHGFVPKAPNDTAKFLRGDGTWAAVGGVTTVIATDVFWDAKGDLAAGTGADAASRLAVGGDYSGLIALASESTGLKWAPGASILLYDYTVAGSDKASIDTGVDTPDAGYAGTSAFPALRTLEVWIVGRTDEAIVFGTCNLTFNNDTGANYDQVQTQVTNATHAGANSLAQNQIVPTLAGNSLAANYAGVIRLSIPGYAGTTFYKAMEILSGTTDSTAANNRVRALVATYKSTSAITRIKVTPGGAAKLKIGSRLIVYAH